MSTDKPKLLYIAGWDRSGSTILEQILGQLEGFFTVGELTTLWDAGPDALCGCGMRISNCETWRSIFAEAFGVKLEDFDFTGARGRRLNWVRLRHLWLLANPLVRRLMGRSLQPQLQLTEKVYRAVGRVSGARVIVDSSKRPGQAYLLELAGLGVPYIMHLVRDPRGCAYSYQIPKPHPDPKVGRMKTARPSVSSLKWMGANASATALWAGSPQRYLRVRYEDFMAAPEDTIRRILEFVGEPVCRLPFLSADSVILEPRHGVFGNPNRFNTGAIQLKFDERWKFRMKQRDKFLVTALTIPWLRKYGYSLKLNGTRHAGSGIRMPQSRDEH